jgi:hypothetical protein
MNEGMTPAEWVGERVRARMETDEEISGTLEGITDHGIIINKDGGRQRGPSFYSWSIVQWITAYDRQTTGEA